MKLTTLFTFLFAFLFTANAQEVIIKGTLRCMNNGEATSTRGAVNIVIIPSFNPKASVATTTTPQGFFQISTGWNATDLRDKDVSLFIITKCSSCKNVQRIFISEDLDKRNTDPNKMYVTIKGWKILENCTNTELADIMSQKLLDSAYRLPAMDISGKATGSQALGPVSFINLFQKLATIAATAGVGTFTTTAIMLGKIKFGIFLHSSAMTNTDNTGFNFSPSRNLSEAVFWNAAAIANSVKPNNISPLANFKNNIKLSGYHQISKQFYIGAGGIYTKQDQVRQITINNAGNPLVNHPDKLEEYAIFLAPVYKINNQLSAAATIKSVWQKFNNPNVVILDQTNGTHNTFNDDIINKQNVDVDLSLSYKINNSLQAGASVMNAGGTKLYADMFVPNQANKPFVNQRGYGVGLCYRAERFNFGVDGLFTDDGFYDASLGINYVPFNNALITGGVAFKQGSFSLSFKLKHFKIGYVYDNNLVINDVKVGTSSFFNGHIYSGFIFDF